MTVLVTGGAGYIGSHAVQRLLRDGQRVVALDNEFRGHAKAMELLSIAHPGKLTYVKADINDRARVLNTLNEHAIDTVMHFAALAYVGESVSQPLNYYHNNVSGLVNVLSACDAARVPIRRIVFSSSCATYGQPPANMIPVPETCPQSPVSPYGWTKLHGEHILRDFAHARATAGSPVSLTMLRYFNVAGSDHTGLIGEDHTPETHMIPVVLQAALGIRSEVGIFGTDYPTPDGTCIRDYVHVEDLIDAHVLAMEKVQPGAPAAFNVGIGKGYSVREIVQAVRKVTDRNFKVVEQPRRPGDPPMLYNDSRKIASELGWKAKFADLHDIIGTAWKWYQKHPQGYKS
ncbi:MAG: UDP-glucose 4-epimerase GalE [Phycisphaerales bacterium]|jgi:UDP-glucose 4-epimerase